MNKSHHFINIIKTKESGFNPKHIQKIPHNLLFLEIEKKKIIQRYEIYACYNPYTTSQVKINCISNEHIPCIRHNGKAIYGNHGFIYVSTVCKVLC